MRKIVVLLLTALLVCSLCVSVCAVPAANSANLYGTVSSDGSCQVTLTVNLHLDRVVEDLRFPLPKNASNITVNGARARSRVENGLRQVDISGIAGKIVGDFSLTFTYTLSDLVGKNSVDQLELQLPVLSGFAYPVQALEISVMLPGPVTAKPAFSSGYHMANIEKDIYCTTTGATITAVTQTELKDHETLTMTLLVTEEMFPQKRIVAPNFQTVNTLTTVFFVVALLYWVIFLRNLPTWPTRRPTPPEGYTAGELGSALHLQGGDLSMMVFSWAQLGYLVIQMKPGGKVILHRQMDMGNERSAFEQRCFKQLFGSRTMVDTGSPRYGDLYRSVQKMRPNVANLVHRRSGNLMAFRAIAAVSGMFCGVSVAMGLTSGAVLQWLMILLLGFLSLCSSWLIQAWAVNLLVSDRRPLWIALGLCGIWMVLAALAGQFGTGLGMATGQLFAGLLAALGGRRTPAGRQVMGETLGLRRYLKTVPRDELTRICQNDPDYFHRMFPYAMGLGVDKAFAKQFGKHPIGPCPYVITGFENDMRAEQWRGLLRRVLEGMNAQRLNSWKEKLADLIQLITR